MTDKRVLYVGKLYFNKKDNKIILLINIFNIIGGLDENVTEDIVRHLFTTFGEVLNVDMPPDPGTSMF